MIAGPLTAAEREALRRLSRRGDLWTFAYQVDVNGPTLGRLHNRGLVDVLFGRSANRWRVTAAGRAALAVDSGDVDDRRQA